MGELPLKSPEVGANGRLAVFLFFVKKNEAKATPPLSGAGLKGKPMEKTGIVILFEGGAPKKVRPKSVPEFQ